MLQRRSTLIWLGFFAFVCILLPASFIGLHVLTASDGARLSNGTPLFIPLGSFVSPYYPDSSELQEGDLVMEVSGKSMEAWADDLFRFGEPRPNLQLGEEIRYRLIRQGERIDVNVTMGHLPVDSILKQHWGAILFAFVSQILATFVLIRRPKDSAARALFIWAMSGSHTYAWSFFLQISDVVGGIGFWLYRLSTPGLWLIYWPAALHVALVFPKPLSITRKIPALIPILYLSSYAIYMAFIFISLPGSVNTLAWLQTWFPAENFVAIIFLIVTIIVMIRQYFTSQTGQERSKIRWAVYGATISGTLGLSLWLIAPAVLGVSLLNANLLGLLMLLFPLSLAVAIWRHQLFDIDVIIRRTLVYFVLTVLLISIYFFIVILLQSIFSTISGQDSPVAVVISTLVIAGLFNPLRLGVQKFIDRHFFRSKYNAQQAIQTFALSARDETDLETISDELVEVVRITMQPEHVTLWLKSDRKGK